MGSRRKPRTGAIKISSGYLAYANFERQTDRYGTVFLYSNAGSAGDGPPHSNIFSDVLPASGVKGSMVFHVFRPCEPSPFSGDWFRGIFAEPVKEGERITLGHGRFFKEYEAPWGYLVGLKPLEKRQSDWLDPKMVHRASGNYGVLYFIAD